MPFSPSFHNLYKPDDNDNTTDTSGLFLTYSVVIPCLSIVGIFGNALSLYILSINTK
jgi:hypothetical protein